jgi:hypothetical protein
LRSNISGEGATTLSDRRARVEDEDDRGVEPQQNEISLDYSGEAVVVPKESLPKPPQDKRIHPRRPLPQVPQAPPEDEDKEDGKQ